LARIRIFTNRAILVAIEAILIFLKISYLAIFFLYTSIRIGISQKSFRTRLLSYLKKYKLRKFSIRFRRKIKVVFLI
jgi:hypothetical protein